MKESLWLFGLNGGFLLLLLVINAVLVACEISMVKLRYAMEEGAGMETLRANRAVNFLTTHADWAAQVIRFGIMASTVGMGLVLYPLFIQLVVAQTVFESMAGQFLLLLAAFVLAGSLVSFFGFLVPRGIAMVQPQRTLLLVSWIVVVVVVVLLPWFKVLRVIARRVFRLMGVNFKQDFNILDFEVQIRALADDEPALSPQTRKIVQNALKMRDLEVSDVVLPRHQVQVMDLDKSLEANLAMARETGHTRFPLCREDLDKCVGLIHIKDLFRWPGDIKSLNLSKMRREMLSFGDNTPLEAALAHMLARKVHMALVKDEFGGVIGVITLENILERLVGDIHDEFDIPEEARVSSAVGGVYQVDGLTPIHELEESLDVEIEETEASTFGGYLTEHLGRLPERGETFRLEEPGLEVTVEDVDEKRILAASVRRLEREEDEGD